MSNIYFCSDPHYHHKNLVRGVSSWSDKSGCRPFESIEAHNEAIVNGINSVVGGGDILWCLGDWSFGGVDKIWDFRKQLNCRNIHLILGNHDHHIENNKTLLNCRVHNPDEKQEPKLNLGWIDLVSCNTEHKRAGFQAQNLFASVSYYNEIKIHGHRIVLSHYAFDVWNKRHHGAFHLFGHSHNTLPDRGDRRLDVGVESAYQHLGEWRPFSFKEIQKILQPRPVKPLDHHTKETTE